MNTTTKNYTRAVTELLSQGGDADTVFKGLRRMLEARGAGRLYSHILRSISTQVAHTAKRQTERARVARESDVKKFKEEIGGRVIYVDETLIGGYVVESKDTIVDASYKRHLLNLYRNIVTKS